MLCCWANLRVSHEIVTIFGLIIRLIANLKQWLQDETSISRKAYHFCSAIATISIFICYIMTISNLLFAAFREYIPFPDGGRACKRVDLDIYCSRHNCSYFYHSSIIFV